MLCSDMKPQQRDIDVRSTPCKKQPGETVCEAVDVPHKLARVDKLGVRCRSRLMAGGDSI